MVSVSELLSVPLIASSPRKQFTSFKIHVNIAETEPPKWWEKNAGPYMKDTHSTQEFLGALSEAGDKLVIVEFYGTWCPSCRALFPKMNSRCLAEEGRQETIEVMKRRRDLMDELARTRKCTPEGLFQFMLFSAVEC